MVRHVAAMAHVTPVTVDTSRDPLSRMRVHELIVELLPDSFDDAKNLRSEAITAEVAGQLYAAAGSILANISEGYCRSSGKDRAKIFEYALGSVRECMGWYTVARSVLGEKITRDRLNRLEEMRRMLLAIVPRERGRPMK